MIDGVESDAYSNFHKPEQPEKSHTPVPVMQCVAPPVGVPSYPLSHEGDAQVVVAALLKSHK